MIQDGYNYRTDGLSPLTYWDDIRVEPEAKTTGANAPTFSQWFTNGLGSRGVYFYLFDNAAGGSEKEIFFNKQMPHGWAGTDIHLHVHWVASSTAASSKVRWGLEYTLTNPGQDFPNTTIIYADTDIYGATGTTIKKHTITEFSPITPSATQNAMSCILAGRLFRDSANGADSYTGDAGLLYIDAHIEFDAAGSGSEYTK